MALLASVLFSWEAMRVRYSFVSPTQSLLGILSWTRQYAASLMTLYRSIRPFILLSVYGFSFTLSFLGLAAMIKLLYFSACSCNCLSNVFIGFSYFLAYVVLSWLIFPIKLSFWVFLPLSNGIPSFTIVLRLQSKKSKRGISSHGWRTSREKTTTWSFLSISLSY